MSVAIAAAGPNAPVLHPADLPHGFAPESTSSKPGAGGLQTYDAVYTKPGVMNGLVRVESKAIVFPTVSLSQRGMSVLYAHPRDGFRRITVGWRIGDESALYLQSKVGPTSGVRLNVYLVVWRSGTIVGAVYGGGIAQTFDVAQVIALARRQQARIARA